ncbi:MAG: cysteine desulfurase, partial [Clostridia bacterium]|nr:cysteine desulfurase [Clostridia bacterium]
MIYLDNSATTPLCEKAIERINVAIKTFGNPSSLHNVGFEAERLKESARESIMKALGVRKFSGDKLIFTSGGTEANNLAVFGSVYSKPSNKGKKIITTDSEHPSVLTPFQNLEKEGYKVVYLSTKKGKIDLDEVKSVIDSDTVFISIMSVNNETGAVYDVREIFSLAKRINPKITTHTDCVQGFLKIPFSPSATKADLVSISSHKIHGPKGVGALYVSADTVKTKRLVPLQIGGGQEEGFRSGTENMLGICGFGGACEYEHAHFEENTKRMRELRNYLTENLKDIVTVNEPETSAPHVVNITLPDI